MTETAKIIFSIISAIGVFAGILAWWISKLKKKKKDIITNALEIQHLQREVGELKGDVKELKGKFEKYKEDNYEK